MSDDELKNELTQLEQQVSNQSVSYNFTQEDVEYLWGLWADFSIYLVYPNIPSELPPKPIVPLKGEFAHLILDYGNELKTSRGEDLLLGNRTFGKLMQTVDKMIELLVSRARQVLERGEGGSGGTGDQEIQVAFDGFEILQRKAFRTCIESEHNVLVTNFDPGDWGERQLRCFNELVERGYLRIRM